jgi:hypothetical protein
MPKPYVPRNKAAKEHRGRVEKVVFTDPSQPFVILALDDGATAIGPAHENQFTGGVIYRFLGRWEDDSSRGPRFRFSAFLIHAAHSRQGVVKYLTENCTGIGAKTAAKIFDQFGGSGVEILRTNPGRVADDCGIDAGICGQAASELAHAHRFEDTKISLFELFQGRGFTGQLITECLDRWGERAPSKIKRNPYSLLGLPSAGFKRCDKLWSDLGLPKDALKRTGILCWNIVQNDSNGHVWLNANDVAAKLREMVPGADAKKSVLFSLRCRKLKSRRDTDNNLWLASYDAAVSEERIAASIQRLNQRQPNWPVADIPVSQTEDDRLPSEHQVAGLRSATAQSVGLFLGSPGTGKALVSGTPVLTPSGYVPIENIRVGDRVIGSNGKPTEVTGIYPQGLVECYRVKFSDGVAVDCCGDHLWFTATRSERKRAQYSKKFNLFASGNVRSTRSISTSLVSSDGHPNHYIPLVEPVQFASHDSELPIDPYVLGVLLGDGHLGKKIIQVTTPDGEIVSLVSNLLPAGTSIKRHKVTERCPSYQISASQTGVKISERNPVLRALRDLGLAGLKSIEKFVPSRFLLASPSERHALLQGLLDTDGYTDGHIVEYSTSSPRLADDFVFLVESLGGTCSVSWRIPKFTYKGEDRTGKPSARIYAKLPPAFAPFRLKRKAERYITRSKYHPYRQIVSVEPIGNREATCISVDSQDHLYVCNRFVVTHNTHTLAYLLRSIGERYGYGSIRVSCPTGKAAVRATQALASAGVPIVARTIHSTLEIGRNGHDGSGWGFKRNRGNPLECQFLIIDESSMIDSQLMASVLDAVPTGGHVLLVGDPNQLPPVGPGAPLRDMVAAGVPRGELSQVRRNAGSIVHACLRIKNGESFETVDQVDIDAEPPQNLKLIETRSDSDSARALVEVLKRMSRFHPLWQTQVVVARNKSGEVSREKLNELLQPILNPDGRQLASNPFRVGDKIICTRNSDMKAVQADYDTQNALDYHDIKDDDGNPEQVYIANGEIGRVVAISERVSIARFSEGDTLVRIPMGKQKADDDSDEGGQGCNFDLAFAVTCHRLQGSEAPCVIVMGDEGGGMIASREWIYTAISRASKLCILIGKMSTFDRMRSRVVLTKRKTFLVELIQSLNSGETHAG